MDKPNTENVMALAFELARIREEHGAQSGMYLSEVRALRAEVERLAAQSAPNLLDAFKSGNAILIDWPMEPVTPQEALKLMDMMDAEYTKTVGKSSPDREMAVCMQRVQHMACDLWASQKEVMRSHFVELVAAQPSQAPVVQAGSMKSYLDFVLEPRHINEEVSAAEYEQALAELRLLRDRASSGATTAAPFAKDSWQHAVDNHLSALGKTSEEFANPHEAVRWLLELTAQIPDTTAQAVKAPISTAAQLERITMTAMGKMAAGDALARLVPFEEVKRFTAHVVAELLLSAPTTAQAVRMLTPEQAHVVACMDSWATDKGLATYSEAIYTLRTLLDFWHGGHIQVRPEANGAWSAAVDDGESVIARAKEPQS